jgi:hypothetical protein
MDFSLLFEHFPELYKPNLRKTHQKQWQRFLTAFCDLCVWVHCSRARHKFNRGIVLYASWWDKHMLNSHRWHFDVKDALEPYVFTDGHYDYSRKLAREWYVTPEFKERSARFVSDYRFRVQPKWRSIIENLITFTDAETLITRSVIKLPMSVEIPKTENIEAGLILVSYIEKLKDGLPITYSVANTGRLHHPLQNIKKDIRAYLFDDWYSYDIRACAPAILKQLYYKLEPLEALPAIEVFIQRRTEIREKIAIQTGLPEITIKRALTGLFFGLTVPSQKQVSWDIKTTQDTFKFSMLIAFGPEVTGKLLSNELFNEIVIECQKKIMRRIARHLREEQTRINGTVIELTNSAGGIKRFNRWNTRQAVAHTYFGYERQVIDVVSEHLNKLGASYLLIHDGWLSNKQIDMKQLEQEINDQLGFDLSIDESRLISSSE